MGIKWNITIENVRDFNLKQIFDCGQCFRWKPTDPDNVEAPWFGIAGSRPAVVGYDAEQELLQIYDMTLSGNGGHEQGETVGYHSAEQGTLVEHHAAAREFWFDYFDLGRDYGEIKRMFRADPSMAEAIEIGSGIRILKQEPWEALVSFIVSQNNNITRIRGCIESLARELGAPAIKGSADCFSSVAVNATADSDTTADSNATADPDTTADLDATAGPDTSADLDATADSDTSADSNATAGPDTTAVQLPDYGDSMFYRLPTPQELAEATLDDLAPCRLGYRSKYLIETGRQISENSKLCQDSGLDPDAPFLDQLAEPGCDGGAAVEALRKVCGVGPKVANCVSLFGLAKIDCFPIDVWMKRVMNQVYGIDESDLRGMQQYAAEHFAPYGGIAQQYLFNYIARQK